MSGRASGRAPDGRTVPERLSPWAPHPSHQGGGVAGGGHQPAVQIEPAQYAVPAPLVTGHASDSHRAPEYTQNKRDDKEMDV